MSRLNILSGGAAQGLVASLAPAFKAQTGFDITGEFGAVGTMAEKLRRGISADIIILTAAIVGKLADEKLVAASSISDIGLVETALAVRFADPQVTVSDAAGLRNALLATDVIFLPDTKASTAGIHVAKVLAQLGIADDVAARLRSSRTGQPPCANWQRRMRGVRSVARNRPRSSVPTASSCPVHCQRAVNSRPCTPQVSPHRLRMRQRHKS